MFDRRYISLSMVTFVDLLGFSDRVRSLEEVTELEALERDVRRVQRWFDHKPDDGSIKDTQKLLRKRVLAFSDCLVIAVSAHSRLTRMQGDFDVFMNELANLAYAQARCVVNSIFIRGAADFGMWYHRKDTMISPAMVGAYDLERRACVPMIAISDELRSHLEDHPHRKFYSEESEPLARYLRFYDDLPNGQAHWLIDYLPLYLEAADGTIASSDRPSYQSASPKLRDHMRNVAYWRDVAQMAAYHRDAIRDAYAAASLDSVREKYRWLGSYHDDAVQRFWPGHPADLLIGELGS